MIKLSGCARIAVPCLLAMSIAACGGGGGASDPVPATISLSADAAELSWNAPASVDVLANDTASTGSLTLVSVTQPAHGQASVSGGRLLYTPDAGFFGSDRVSYTARASDGGATASADLIVTVGAELRLEGFVSVGSPLVAEVTAEVGSSNFTTPTDAQGTYSVTIRSSDPVDRVTLTARGSGDRATVRLASSVGDVGTLVRSADAAGVLHSTQAPALNLTALSTALGALVAEANGGAFPATAATVDALSMIQSPRRVVDLAAVVELVANQGVALPAGAADTLRLLEDPSTSPTLAEFLFAQTTGANASRFDQARATVQRSAMPSGVPASGSAATRSVAYTTGTRTSGVENLVVSYRDDGSATVVRRGGAVEAAWSADAGALDLVLAQPYSYSGAVFDNALGGLVAVRYDTSGYVLRQVTGSANAGLVLVVEQGVRTVLDGPAAGSTQSYDETAGTMHRATDLSATVPLQASDFAGGARWAGLVDGPFTADPGVDPGNAPAADIGEFNGANVTLLGSGRSFGWMVADGWLRTTPAGADRRYARIWRDDSSGEEHWLAADFVGGAMVRVVEVMVAAAQPGLVLAADASSTRHWENPYSAATTRLFQDAYSDGTGALVDVSGNVLLPSTWDVTGDGILRFSTEIQPGTTRIRGWIPVRRTASRLIVLETYSQPDAFDFRRMAAYEDLGPSGR